LCLFIFSNHCYAKNREVKASLTQDLKKKSGPKVGIVRKPHAPVHAMPSHRSEQVTEVLLGDEFRVIKEKGQWLYGSIPIQMGYRGWIRKSHLIFPKKGSPFYQKGYILHIRDPHTTVMIQDGKEMRIYAGTRLPLFDANPPLPPLEKGGKRGFYTIILPDGRYGMIEKSSAIIEDLEFGRIGRDVTPDGVMDTIKFFGSRYRWGGTTEKGMDCSGFVYLIFRVNGIFLERDSIDQSRLGIPVSRDDLAPGDLVFFQTRRNRISHVGIYLGNGKFIHSSSRGKGVVISDLSEEFYSKRFVKAMRVMGI
jgi:hypothetical protein